MLRPVCGSWLLFICTRPYVGPSGWVGVWLDERVDWDELTDLLRDSYTLIAPKRLAALLREE